MPKCDFCSTVLDDKSGLVVSAYTIKKVAKHPDFSISMIKVWDGVYTLADMYKMQGVDFGEAHWRDMVMNDTTPWLLCARCQTSAGPFMVDKALDDIRDLILRKLAELESRLSSHPGKQWLTEFIFPFISEHMFAICAGAEASIGEANKGGDWYTYSFQRNDISVFITAYPAGSPKASNVHFKNGYFCIIDALRDQMKEGGHPENHLLHFQFFPERLGAGLAFLSLTVFPNKKLENFYAIVLPIELLSDEERKMVDEKNQGTKALTAPTITKPRQWWRFWKS